MVISTPELACDGENRLQVVAGLRSIQDYQSPAACQGSLCCIQWALARVFAVGAGDGLQGQSCLGPVVEGVEDDAIRESLRRLAAGGKLPDGLGGQGGLAHATRAADGDGPAGLQVLEQRGKLGLSAGEMRDSRRPLEGQANLCGLVVDEIALDLELAGEERAVRFAWILV